MFHSDPEKREQERKSVETSPPELRQPLAYILHLRSYWKPERHTKLIVPTSWMEFLTFADGKRGVAQCDANQCCPFRNVRFESVAETRLVAPDEELPRDIMSHLLTNFGIDDLPATLVPRVFEGIPHTRLRSDMPATGHSSQNISRCIDFGLVLEHGDADTENIPEDTTRCLLFGMKEPTQMQHHSTCSAPFDHRSALTSIPEELTSQGQFHLTLLTSLIKREGVELTKPFPEWLVLFGLIYDVHRVLVIACVPHRHKSDVMECAAYVVDELWLHSAARVPASVSTCQLALERLRFLLALTTLRRHVHNLAGSLCTTNGSFDGISRGTGSYPSLHDCCAHDQHAGSSIDLDRCASLGSSQHCGSEYSTCPSSASARDLNDVRPPQFVEDLSSSSTSFTSSFCSTCLRFLESVSASDSLYSEDSKCTTPPIHMEPPTLTRPQRDNESTPCPHKLTEIKRRDIIDWAQHVMVTEHPVKDTYRMVVYHPILDGKNKVADSKSSTRG